MTKRLISLFICAVLVLQLFFSIDAAAYDKDDYVYASLENPEYTFDNLKQEGGFYTYANGWIYFANKKDSFCLYALNADDGESFKMTDFAVANLNYYGGNLYFTDISATAVDIPLNGDSEYGETFKIEATYGGKMYMYKGADEPSEGEPVYPFGNDSYAYYKLNFTDEGFSCLVVDTTAGDDSFIYARLDKNGEVTGVLQTTNNESIMDKYERDGYLYLEVQNEIGSNEAGYMLRVNLENGAEKKEKIPGVDMKAYNGEIYFIGAEDGYLYVMGNSANNAVRISVCAISSYDISGGVVQAIAANGNTNIMISEYEMVHPFDTYETKMAGGYYNYLEKILNEKGSSPKGYGLPIQPWIEPLQDAKEKAGIEDTADNKHGNDDADEVGSQKTAFKQLAYDGMAPARDEEIADYKGNNMPFRIRRNAGMEDKAGSDESTEDKDTVNDQPVASEDTNDDSDGQTEMNAESGAGSDVESDIEPEEDVIEDPLSNIDPILALKMVEDDIINSGNGSLSRSYYDSAALKAYYDYYTDTTNSSCFDIGNIVLSSGNIRDSVASIGVSSGGIDAIANNISNVFKSAISNYSFSEELLQVSDDGSAALVRVTVSNYIDIDAFDNISQNQIQTMLFDFLNSHTQYSQRDFTSGNEAAIVDFFAYVFNIVLTNSSDSKQVDIKVYKDATIGWKVEKDGTYGLEALVIVQDGALFSGNFAGAHADVETQNEDVQSVIDSQIDDQNDTAIDPDDYLTMEPEEEEPVKEDNPESPTYNSIIEQGTTAAGEEYNKIYNPGAVPDAKIRVIVSTRNIVSEKNKLDKFLESIGIDSGADSTRMHAFFENDIQSVTVRDDDPDDPGQNITTYIIQKKIENSYPRDISDTISGLWDKVCDNFRSDAASKNQGEPDGKWYDFLFLAPENKNVLGKYSVLTARYAWNEFTGGLKLIKEMFTPEEDLD